MFDERDFLGYNKNREAKYKSIQEKFIEAPLKKSPFTEGKLYTCPYHLIVYPSHLFAAKAFFTQQAGMARGSSGYVRHVTDGPTHGALVEQATRYWSAKFGCTVRYSSLNEPFLYLGGTSVRLSKRRLADDLDLNTHNFLFLNFTGWVVYTDDCNIEQVK